MKTLIKKITLFTTASLLLALCSSFSNPPKENETILRNIEALSRGENSPGIDCVDNIGHCVLDGKVTYGMTKKE